MDGERLRRVQWTAYDEYRSKKTPQYVETMKIFVSIHVTLQYDPFVVRGPFAKILHFKVQHLKEYCAIILIGKIEYKEWNTFDFR